MIMEHLAVDWAEVQVPERNVDQKEEWLDNKTNKQIRDNPVEKTYCLLAGGSRWLLSHLNFLKVTWVACDGTLHCRHLCILGTQWSDLLEIYLEWSSILETQLIGVCMFKFCIKQFKIIFGNENEFQFNVGTQSKYSLDSQRKTECM